MLKIVTKIAITHHPRAIIVEFKKGLQENKLFHKKVTFHRVNEKLDENALATIVIQKYPDIFESVSRLIVEKMLKILLNRNDNNNDQVNPLSYKDGASSLSDNDETSNLSNHEESGPLSDNEGNYRPGVNNYGSSEDLNGVSEEELYQAKKAMDEIFELKKVTPIDDHYEYDRRVDYYPESDSSWD